jgi:glycosyltransferase involved in cell wall biosynthesis
VATKKGLIPLVKALAEQPGSPASALDLAIVGPDERGHAAEVRRLIDSLGLGGRVRLVGPVFDVHEKARWYAHAAVFCLPSADENFGLTVVEASRFGVPLLVSPDVGLAPAIAKNGAGLAVPAEPASIALALADLVGPRRTGFSEGALRLGAAFEWPERAAELEAMYYQAVAKR